MMAHQPKMHSRCGTVQCCILALWSKDWAIQPANPPTHSHIVRRESVRRAGNAPVRASGPQCSGDTTAVHYHHLPPSKVQKKIYAECNTYPSLGCLEGWLADLWWDFDGIFWDAKPWVFLAPKSQGNYSFHYLKQKVLLEQRVYLAIFLGLLYPYRKTRTLHARELSVNVKLTYIGPVVPSGAQCPSILRNCLLGPSNWGGLMGADPGQALLGEGSHQNPSEQFFKESCQSQFTLKRDFTKDI